MGFSVKIAPGVRIRASSRGFSAGVGPRAARVHVGTRGVGVSTGAGPFGAYAHLGGGSRRSPRGGGGGGSRGGYGGGGGGYGGRPVATGPSRSTLAALERAARQAEREEQIAKVAEIERQLVSVHLEAFPVAHRRVLPDPKPPAIEPIRERLRRENGVYELTQQLGDARARPKAADPEPVDLQALIAEERRSRLDGIGVFKRADRREAKAAADEAARQRADEEAGARAAQQAVEQQRLDQLWAELHRRRQRVDEMAAAEVERLLADARASRDEAQAQLDAEWERLAGNDPHTVISVLEAAFADNGAPATPIDCQGDVATVTMLYGHPDVIPDKTPAVTPGGKPTLRKRTKADRNDLYLRALASNVLATLKEGFAVCPGLNAISIVVVRRQPTATGEKLAAVYAATFIREQIRPLNWTKIDPSLLLDKADDWLLNLRGQASEVSPLDLCDEAELQQVLEHLAAILDVPALKPKAAKKAPPAATARAAMNDTAPAVSDARSTAASVDGLDSRDADARYDAITALRERRDPGAIGPLLRAVDDADRHVRRQAVGALADLSDRRCRDVLMRLLDDHDSDIRWEALCGLREMLDADMAPALRRLASDSDRYVRSTAIGALGDLGLPDTRPVLHTAAADPDPDVRYTAITALADSPTADDSSVLADALADDDRYTREAAARGLGRLRDPVCVPQLIELLGHADADTRRAAVDALGDIGGTEAQTALTAAKDDPDADVREAAIWALGRS